MLVLLFLWSIAQPIAVIETVPSEIRYRLYFWKNMFGVIIIVFGSLILFTNLARRKYPFINLKLFLVSLLFPIFSIFNMLFRGYGTSIQEQILYFLWPFTLFVIFPAFFPTAREQRKGLMVILSANLIALGYGIFPYLGQENIINLLSYQYRIDFGFTQPNIYSSSWAVVFGCSLYFYYILRSRSKKLICMMLCTVSLLCIVMAHSESILLFCIGILLVSINSFIRKKVNVLIRASLMSLLLGGLALIIVNYVPDYYALDIATSGRIEVWSRSISLNIEADNIFDFLFGNSSLHSGNLKYTGERIGFQAARAQVDNAYLARFLQNGFIGLSLYYAPFVMMLGFFYRKQQFAKQVKYPLAWVMGAWIGTFLALIGLDVIPSFGNVLNIFLFVASAPALAGLPQRKPSLSRKKVLNNINFHSPRMCEI